MYRLTIDRMVLESGRKFGEATALAHLDRSGKRFLYTYSELAKRLDLTARGLIAEGVRPGDRIALLSANHPRWGLAALAAMRAGAILVPVDQKSTRRELSRLLEHAGVHRLFISRACFERLKVLPAVEKLYFLDKNTRGSNHGNLDDLARLGAQQIPLKRPLRSADDTALIVYTSGTTGDPKGVMLSHRNVLTNMEMILNRLKAASSDSFASILPLSHMLEFTCGFCLPLHLGCSVHSVGSFNPADISRVMQDCRATIMIGVPRLYQAMWKKYQDRVRTLSTGKRKVAGLFQGLTRRIPFLGKHLFKALHEKFGANIRFWVSGGAALDPELVRGFASVGIPIINGYGLTETAPVLTANSMEEIRPTSVGRPLPGVEVKIIDPNEQGVGQVAARGLNIFRGYYKNKAATDECFRDGWYLTGDLGWMDPRGFLELRGRAKTLIVSPGGMNIHPEEVEEYLQRSEYFQEVAVVGLPQEGGHGEVVTAIVVPTKEFLRRRTWAEAEDLARKEVRSMTREISDFKRPRRVILRREELPRTHTMKIRRNQLVKEMESRGKAKKVARARPA
jgi:long-chain acyl-CoA synthetase